MRAQMMVPTFVAMFTSVIASASIGSVTPTQDAIAPALVEQVVVVQKASSDQPSIVLVKADNGGSSDVSSLMAPSRLYLGIHLDGEMFDINGSYLLNEQVIEIKRVTYDKASATIYVESTYKDETLKAHVSRMNISIAKALAELKTAKSDDMASYALKSSVTLKVLP